MKTADQLQAELENVFSGQPWYGTNIYQLIAQVTFEAAYEKPAGSVHNIAGIILHMLGWTEEVINRLEGQPAGIAARGDWPDPGMPDEQKWQQLVSDLKLANVDLIGKMQHLPEDKWEQPINDQRGDEPVTTYKGLIHGFIQHQIYHAGQIALLNRINYGR
ncbi:DinB family protein [Mucilaginibacter sp. Bleaf8]|uniref:DinB family protein n=1 Tax=Mucilaginibacter sp. Bleaf8 TaxID=2834430 RepID=UPI001BCE65A5|nr:DinB family protein [Mucilaginibacter sp. Bleaf8]MBS7567106.1 DinB family protein [Mucilaginibacter sp. Bleaf8]